MQGQGPQFPPTRKATIHIHRGGRGQVHYIGRGGGACQTWIIWNTFHAVTKSFHHAMREEYLKPTPLKPYMTYADHLVWPIHVPRRCDPLITPHLSLWGNSRTRATFPTHKKSHNPHPQGERGKGVNMGTLHCGGVGGCLPNLDHI